MYVYIYIYTYTSQNDKTKRLFERGQLTSLMTPADLVISPHIGPDPSLCNHEQSSEPADVCPMFDTFQGCPGSADYIILPDICGISAPVRAIFGLNIKMIHEVFECL